MTSRCVITKVALPEAATVAAAVLVMLAWAHFGSSCSASAKPVTGKLNDTIEKQEAMINVLVDDFETTLKPIKVTSENVKPTNPQDIITDINRTNTNRVVQGLPTLMKLQPVWASSSKSKTLTRPYDLDYANSVNMNVLDGTTGTVYRPHHLYYLDTRDKLLQQEHLFKHSATTGSRQKPPKLIKSQHKPPWRWRYQALTRVDDRSQTDLITGGIRSKRRGASNRFRFTTVAPITAMTTTEFFKLISSAHSPIKIINLQEDDEHELILGLQKPPSPPPHLPLLTRITTSTTTTTPQPEYRSMSNNHAAPPSGGRILSPTITVTGGDDDDDNDLYSSQDSSLDMAPANDKQQDEVNQSEDLGSRRTPDTQQQQSKSASSSSNSRDITSVLQFDDDQSLPSAEFTTQLTPKRGAHNGAPAKPVTIVRFPPNKRRNRPTYAGKPRPNIVRRRPPRPSQAPTLPGPPTEAPMLLRQPPQSLVVIDPSSSGAELMKPTIITHLARSSTTTSTPHLGGGAYGSQLVRLIAKQKHKHDDKVLSPTLTVVDNDAVRLPLNATSVHNNKLIVAIRPGRPKRPQPSTTQFPVYNIVAGITPPYSPNPSTSPYLTRPPSPSSIYGLLRPPPQSSAQDSGGNSQNSTLMLSTTPLPLFGAQNIKFPAAEPSNQQHLEHQNQPLLPDRFNLTLAGDELNPIRAPDKIQIQEAEQQPPADAVIQSDATIVSRPYGQETMTNQEGIMKLKTTRKPARGAHTTPRVSIVSANTTIVAGNPEQLHDVLSNVIAGSHHNSHHVYQNQRPNPRPGFFAFIGSIFSNSIFTSVMGVFTLMKTIFVALLVMFLPPMALAAAIMQAINIG